MAKLTTTTFTVIFFALFSFIVLINCAKTYGESEEETNQGDISCRNLLNLIRSEVLQPSKYQPYKRAGNVMFNLKQPNHVTVGNKEITMKSMSSCNLINLVLIVIFVVAAMGIDLPDFLLNYNGKLPIHGSYREKMERNGR